MVVTDLPAISDIWVWHENARLPSICTMHAPHRPVPQPNLVPVSLRSSRITHNNGVVGGASLDAALPFTVKLMAMVFLLENKPPREVANRTVRPSLLAFLPASTYVSAALTRAGLSGRSRMRLPVALAKALATAATAGPCEPSPAPSGRSFERLINSTSTFGASGMVRIG